MATRTIVWRRSQLDQLLRAPNGTVGQHMRHVSAAVTREAKTVAGQRLQRGPGPRHYADSFKSEVARGRGGELRFRVTNTRKTRNGRDLAAILEAGSRPHLIRPRKVGGVLVFTARDGRTVFAREVMHPGTRAYRIMETALRRVVGRDR